MRRLILLVFSVIFLVPLAAGAVGISPAKYSFVIDAGKSAEGAITVLNNENEIRIFNISVVGAKQNAEGYPEFGTGLDKAEGWIKLEKTKVTLKPGAQSSVGFTVKVPAGSSPLSHQLGVAVESLKSENLSMGITGRAVALVRVQVAGTVTEALKIESWQIKPASFWQDKRGADIKIANKGTVPVTLSGKIVVTGRGGETVSEFDLVLGSELQPNANRVRGAEIDLKDIKYPGLYRANLVVDYGESGLQTRAAQPFFYAPLYQVGLLAGLLVLFAGFLIFKLRRKK